MSVSSVDTLSCKGYKRNNQRFCREFILCGGRVVKPSTLQRGSRGLESHRVRTDMAGWFAISQLTTGTDCLTAGHLALGTAVWGNGLCKLRCLISRIPVRPFGPGYLFCPFNIGDDTIIKETLLLFHVEPSVQTDGWPEGQRDFVMLIYIHRWIIIQTIIKILRHLQQRSHLICH